MASKLTNKFTKSVLEREQKEQKTLETVTPAAESSNTSAPLAEKPVVESMPVQQPAAPVIPAAKPVVAASAQQTAPATVSKPAKKASESAVINLDAFLNPSENRQAKNKTFYLDTAVIDAIKRAAAANHMAESKLVNDILKKVLEA